ncbi:unnamed protein product [Rangifer tarandus platyrhynchus]|uniref:Uncharacterized protein n=2 Tax=Rangifer tarandus platyrhynchus TaxID=3082113 RepID=A0AC60A4H4_RANTA
MWYWSSRRLMGLCPPEDHCLRFILPAPSCPLTHRCPASLQTSSCLWTLRGPLPCPREGVCGKQGWSQQPRVALQKVTGMVQSQHLLRLSPVPPARSPTFRPHRLTWPPLDILSLFHLGDFAPAILPFWNVFPSLLSPENLICIL